MSRTVSTALLFVVILIGIGRIVSTYTVFTHTIDEGAHIAAGMQFLDKGIYSYEPKHPPLARLAAAAGPYLASLRSPGVGMWRDGYEILYAGSSYFGPLSLARAGILLFFTAGVIVVWVWTRQIFDDVTAIVAAFLFSLLPVILGHSGLATTDMALTATLIVSVYAVARWFTHPTKINAAILGGALALALLSKLTALLLFPACFLAVLGARYGIARANEPSPFDGLRRLWIQGGIAAMASLLVVWAGYGFSFNPLTILEWRPHLSIDGVVGTIGWLHNLTYAAAEAPIYPFVELALGIWQAFDHGVSGHSTYFLGETIRHGRWFYYPVMIFFKTPIPFLLLVAIGLGLMARSIKRHRRWQIGVPIACAAAILLAMLPSTVNIGVRHILPIFPFLAIIAAFGAVALYRSRSRALFCRAAAVLLVSWTGVASIWAHPDYLAYYNLLAGPEPEWIAVDSDLDWGQDQQRLSDEVASRDIGHLWIRIAGPPPERIHRPFPPFELLQPKRPVTGWVAISLTYLKRDRDDFGWLEAYRPVARIGQSILLFYISSHDSAEPPSASS